MAAERFVCFARRTRLFVAALRILRRAHVVEQRLKMRAQRFLLGSEGEVHQRSSSASGSLSVGSIISVPATGNDIVGAWKP